MNVSEVHVWWATVGQLKPNIDDFRAFLSPDECTRADRFYFVADRDRYLASRGMLRSLLAHYEDIDPSMIEFDYGHKGKPSVSTACVHSQLAFSSSHSGDLIVQVFTRGGHIGVDVEKMRQDFPWRDIDTCCFTARERSALSHLPTRLRNRARFSLWTRKEAYLKATGEGIGKLPELELPVDLSGGRGRFSIEGIESVWRLYDLQIHRAYQAALAIEGGIPSIRIQRMIADDLPPRQVSWLM